MGEQQAAAGQETLRPLRLVRRLDADRQRGGEPAGGLPAARARPPSASSRTTRPATRPCTSRRPSSPDSAVIHAGARLRAERRPARAVPSAACMPSSDVRSTEAASSASPPTAAGSPAQTRTVSASTTADSAPVAVPRTSPYRMARTRAGTAAIRRVTSDSVAAEASSARSTGSSASGSVGQQHALDRPGDVGQRRAGRRRRDTILAVAADSTVVPQTAASMIATASSGRQRSVQVSWKVPVPRTRSAVASPQPMPSTPSRCRNTERPRSVSLRRSSASVRAQRLDLQLERPAPGRAGRRRAAPAARRRAPRRAPRPPPGRG